MSKNNGQGGGEFGAGVLLCLGTAFLIVSTTAALKKNNTEPQTTMKNPDAQITNHSSALPAVKLLHLTQ